MSLVRRLILSTVCCLTLPCFLQAQELFPAWYTLSNSPLSGGGNSRFDDVRFMNPMTGWVVSVSDGAIFKTVDGGVSWTQQIQSDDEFGYHVGFRSVTFVNESRGWAGNLNFHNSPIPGRSLFESTNGGTKWLNISNRISGPDPAGICGLWAVNEQLIYGVGRWNGPPMFIKTTDGGNSWTSRDMRPLVTGLVDVYFFSADTGLIVGGNGIGSSIEEQQNSRAAVLYTTDGGANWTKVYESASLGRNCWKISFPSRNVGYIATQGTNDAGLVLKTTDGGLTWKEKFVGSGLGFSGIGFVSDTHGWVGATETYTTFDGGDTWSLANGVGSHINRFRILNDTLGYAVGLRVYKFSPISTEPESPGTPIKGPVPTRFQLRQNYPNPFNPSTNIIVDMPRGSNLTVKIFDVLGREVANLFSGALQSGTHTLAWEPSGKIPGGVYFYRVEAEGFIATKKMVLLK